MKSPGRSLTLYADWLRLWIPKPFDDEEIDRAARLTALVASVGFFAALPIVFLRLASADIQLVVSVALVTLGFTLTLALIRLGRPQIAAHTMLALVMAGSIHTHWRSPALLTPLMMLCIAPLLAGAFAGARASVFWGLTGAGLMAASTWVRPLLPAIDVGAQILFMGNTIIAPGVIILASILAALIERNRNTTQKALRAAMRTARLATEAKTRFLAHMSHEIRTPMNGVIGLADLLDGTQLSDEQRAMTSTLRSSAGSLLHIINQILDFSKVEAGHLELFERPFSIRRVAEEVIALLEGTAQSRGLDLRFEWTDPDGLSCVLGDPERTRQILVNLVGNALKFTDAGAVTLTGRVESHGDGRAQITISVADTGVGIAPEAIGSLFEEFKQVDHAGGHRDSTGLGLAITARLVALMGSKVQVRSRMGYGSTFSFVLDMAVADDFDALNEASAVFDMTPLDSASQQLFRRILIVDDNAVNRLVLGRLLQQLNIGVVSLDGGQAALDLLETDRTFDCIMCDCRMPQLDGYETTRRIRQRETEQGLTRMTIIAVTASVMTDDRNRCTEAGMDGFLSKPVRQKDLRRCLSHWVPALMETDSSGA